MKRGLSIRVQIFIALVSVSAAVVVGFGSLVLSRVQGRAYHLAHAAAVDDARLAAQIASRGLDRTGATFESAVRVLRNARDLFVLNILAPATRVQLVDGRGRLAFDSADPRTSVKPKGRGQPVDSAEITAALSGQTLGEPVVLAGDLVAAAVPVMGGSEVVGAVRVIKPAIGMRSILGEIVPEVAMLALVFLALASLGAVVVGGRLSGPIESLTAAARRVAAGDRTASMPAPSGLEVSALTAAYEDMRRELQDKNRIERFSEDLSHELKNPVASIRSLAEALEAGAIDDRDTASRLLGRIQQASERLEAIVADLMSLARLEAKGIDNSARIALGDVGHAALAEVEARAAMRDVALELDVTRAPRLAADAIWLRRALVNLLANGIAHTGAGGAVSLTIDDGDGGAIVRVRNEPGEVSAELSARLFDRFETKRPEGTGLGLAIVRSVAEAHGGRAFLEESGPPAVVITLRLPA